MKRLRLFETESQHETTKGEFEYPTVSYVRDTDTVHYMTLRDKYTREYLTFEALEAGTFTLSIPANIDSTCMTSVSYSTDNGKTWTTTTVDNTAQTITTPTINARGKVLWKGEATNYTTVGYGGAVYNSYFTSTMHYNVSGNIMSLLFSDDFKTMTISDYSRYCVNTFRYDFAYLFRNSINLISAENLIIPAVLSYSCCDALFYNCTSLTTAPTILPAIRLTSNCYQSMFQGCTALTTAPILPVTTLAQKCYRYMFQNCTSLTTAPALPATTLTSGCYSNMFQGCTALTTAPTLPAANLVNDCYNSMFYGCTNLNYIKAMFTTTPSTSYTRNWVSGVAASGTFVKNTNATWTTTGVNGVPSGWTVQTASE